MGRREEANTRTGRDTVLDPPTGKTVTLVSMGENMEQEQVSRAAGRNANLRNHFRERFDKISS